MYQRLLTPEASSVTPSELYEQATASTALRDEIRLARCRLGMAVQSGDDKLILAWLGMVHALVRVQESVGEAETELQEMLRRISEDVRGAASEDDLPF